MRANSSAVNVVVGGRGCSCPCPVGAPWRPNSKIEKRLWGEVNGTKSTERVRAHLQSLCTCRWFRVKVKVKVKVGRRDVPHKKQPCLCPRAENRPGDAWSGASASILLQHHIPSKHSINPSRTSTTLQRCRAPEMLPAVADQQTLRGGSPAPHTIDGRVRMLDMVPATLSVQARLQQICLFPRRLCGGETGAGCEE